MPTVRLQPTTFVAGGAAMARDANGRVTFIDGALPGEVVDAEITDEQRDFARAVAVEIIEASPERVAAPCPHVARGCGGCGWQHLAPEAQLRGKEQILLDALRRTARLDTPPPVRHAASPAGLRTTIRVGVVDGRAGFRRRASDEIVAVDSCLVSHPLLNDALASGSFGDASEALLRVSVATGDGIALVAPSAAGVHLPSWMTVTDQHGRPAIEEDVAGCRLRVTGDAFFQAGPAVAEALVVEVKAAAGDVSGRRVVDAYGGVGLFARAVAAEGGAAAVEVIESHALAASDARHNLKGHPAKVVRCEVGRWRPSPTDVVIADPARPGLGRPGVTALVAAAPSVLVLVSCDPASLARDTRLLMNAGYRPVQVTLIDAFPHTPHIEAVARFEADPTLVERSDKFHE
ncbi:MAG: class I SAM-dependent RNA methyltransferase [Acidimicrobiales bacterium]